MLEMGLQVLKIIMMVKGVDNEEITDKIFILRNNLHKILVNHQGIASVVHVSIPLLVLLTYIVDQDDSDSPDISVRLHSVPMLEEYMLF